MKNEAFRAAQLIHRNIGFVNNFVDKVDKSA